jgi:hypothetical protein
MKPQSAKAKGRRLQQRVVADLLRAIPALEPGDVRSTSMGAAGLDVLLSPAARKHANFAIECKAVEALNVAGTFATHAAKYADSGRVPILVHTRNRVEPLVTLAWTDFLALLYSAPTKAKR